MDYMKWLSFSPSLVFCLPVIFFVVFFLIAAVGEWHLCACFEVKGRGDRLLVETTASSPAFLLPQQCKEDVGRSCTIAYYYFFFLFYLSCMPRQIGGKKKKRK